MGIVRAMKLRDNDVVGENMKSIAERRAAKCGFNVDRINAPRFRTSPLPSPAPALRSPRLHIPPGISPTALLDSPVMLPNSHGLPSPTTGTFPLLPPPNDDRSVLKIATDENVSEGNGFNSCFTFKNQEDPKYLPDYPMFDNQGTNVDFESLMEQPPMDFEFPMEFPEDSNPKKYDVDPSADAKELNSVMNDNCVDLQMPHSSVAGEHNSHPKELIHGDDIRGKQVLEGDQKDSFPSGGMVRNSEDGYNWRKYGQKHVKGSEYPRSYYKCTHPNCLVKKKVERSFDGQITEIIYKGAPHNHAQPQPNRRTAASLGSSLFDEMSEMGEGSRAKLEAESIWSNIQSGKDIRSGYDGLERTSSTSVLTELSDPLSYTQGKGFESADTPEFSSALASVDEDDRTFQVSIPLENDADVEESETKRRKKDSSSLIETNPPSRAVREPRVVVQIESEIDILDDGYRWRKYGQKVVKGNPNPRSYYKCTSAGCLVRKHVERASHDLKFILTTYEGKHNHPVPAARNSNQGVGNGHASSSNAQPPLALSRNTSIGKPETQVEDLAPHFDSKPEFREEYLRSTYLGNLSNDLKYGASSLYQMKFPPLQNGMSYGSFGLNATHHNMAAHQAGSVPSVVPDFPMSLPLNLPPAGNMALAGYDFNNGKSVCPVQVQPPYFSGQQQLHGNDLRFLKPKQEQKDESLYDVRLPIIDRGNAALSPSSSLLYHRMMGGYQS